MTEIDEAELARQGVQLASTLGYRRYHTYRSKRSEPGWPDEALVRDRMILVEWKTAKGKLSPAQKDWLRVLHAAGVECYVIRPDDLQALADVLGPKGDQRERAQETLRARLAAEIGLEIPAVVE